MAVNAYELAMIPEFLNRGKADASSSVLTGLRLLAATTRGQLRAPDQTDPSRLRIVRPLRCPR